MRLVSLPNHVGIIMDGNGRWATKRELERTHGHREGAAAVRRTVRAAREKGIHALTLYAFSEQNWGRPGGEVEALMGLLQEFLQGERDEILGNGIRLRAIGNTKRLPLIVRTLLEGLINASNHNEGMTLTLALSYGGQEEIAEACRTLFARVASKEIEACDISVAALRKEMPSLAVGDPDLIVRTGGERRISNFLLFGLAYAELHFTDVLWPDFGEADLDEAIAAFQKRERRFGGLESGR
jgi:undecaprenyl diphosphate synthase